MKELDRQIYRFDNFLLDPVNRQLRREDKPIPLAAKAFDLLQTLVESNGRLIGKDELFSSVWQDQIVEESNLTVHISQIRKALGDSRKDPLYIVTVPGYGYRFNGEVSTLDDQFVVETETLSRITIEKEIIEPEVHEISASTALGFLSGPAQRNVTASKPRLTSLHKLGAVATLGTLFIFGGIFWFTSSMQGNVAGKSDVAADDETQIRRLTSKGTVNHGAISPDGKFFAYSLRERGAYMSSLWYGQVSGNGDIQLLPAADLSYNPRSFSSDGSFLYYTVSEPRDFDNGTLFKMPVLGGVPPQKLLSDISVYAVISPDEKQAAFIRGDRDNKSSALVIANLDGSGEREITVRRADQSFLAFSLSWSIDGAKVSFGAKTGEDTGHEIFTTNVADGSVKQITDLEWITISRIEWLRDGSSLLLSARDKNSFAANQIWKVDHESGKAKKITRDLQHYASTLSLSADSNAILTIQATRESNVWIAPAEDISSARQLTFGSSGNEGWYGIDWTPDGKIIYTARTDQSLTLWAVDADGTNAKQLTPAGFLDEKPSVTADGKYIVFQSNRSGSTQVWRMNANGDELRQLTFEGQNSFPHSTPDSISIVYTRTADNANSAWLVSIDGGESIRLSDAECYNARVSPDGNSIACGHRSEGKTKLAIIPITGGEPLIRFDVPPTYNFYGSIRWLPDGRSIAYRDWANGIWTQSLDGGDPKRIEGLPSEKLYHFGWSPNGRQFAFVRGSELRDAVIISNLR